MKKFIISTIFLTLFSLNDVNAAKYKVVFREATNGGLFGYDYVNSELVTYSSESGGVIYNHSGYDVTCRQPGTSSCPRLGAEYRPVNPVDNWDATQVNKADELMQYAINQIAQGSSNGSHSINVLVEGELFLRVYEVVWDSINGTIEITREDVTI